ncbi:MAG TPA: C2H2-type zinc finger protein [Thermoplasmataceae archaeon]|nr:C2H2-type zinc finger protein [Thermoplasmataceae archaeon]
MTENKCDECGQVFASKELLMEHAKMHMGKAKVGFGAGKTIISSVIGGIIGGILMLLVLMAGAAGMGLSATTFALVMGMGLGAPMGSAVMVGVLGHFTVSIVAGAIFGAIVSYVKPLRLKNGVKSLGLGVAFAIVLYLVFFLPMAMAVFAPVMMNMMGAKAAMMLPDVLVIGFAGHVLYGLVLGPIAVGIGGKL